MNLYVEPHLKILIVQALSFTFPVITKKDQTKRQQQKKNLTLSFLLSVSWKSNLAKHKYFF